MLSVRATLLAPLLLLLALAVRTSAYFPQGFITVPANGTAIKPGKPFNFTFNVRSDYCLSSYNYTVYLFTQLPSPSTFFIDEDNQFASGVYLGRYSESTYSNPDPSNPAPPRLIAPDFSKGFGGFGSGQSLTNKTVYLTVIDEYSRCGDYPGARFSLTYNTLIYNATKIK